MAAAGADSILNRHLAADVRDAGPAVPVAVGVRVAEVARRLVAAGAVCWSAAGETVVVILNAVVVASLRVDAADRRDARRTGVQDARRDVLLDVQDARRDVRAGQRRAARADFPVARACPFRGVPAGHQVCQVRLCRVDRVCPCRADQVCPCPVPLAGLAPDGLAERLAGRPLQDGLVEGPDDPAACHHQDDPDARRPEAVRLGGVGDANWAEAVAILAD